jgi:CRP-like cAMP-binding protein
MEKSEMLKMFPLFRNASEDILDKVVKAVVILRYPHEDIIFREHSTAAHLYLILKGQVDLSIEIGSGQKFSFKTLEQKSILGWSALVKPHRRSATAMAKSYVELMEIDAKVMQTLMKSDCEFRAVVYEELLRAVSQRLRDAQHQFRYCIPQK